MRETRRKYRQQPGVKERAREYQQRPEVKERKREYDREYRNQPEVKKHKPAASLLDKKEQSTSLGKM